MFYGMKQPQTARGCPVGLHPAESEPSSCFFWGVQGEMGWLLGGEEPGQRRRTRKDPLSSMGGFEVVMEHTRWYRWERISHLGRFLPSQCLPQPLWWQPRCQEGVPLHVGLALSCPARAAEPHSRWHFFLMLHSQKPQPFERPESSGGAWGMKTTENCEFSNNCTWCLDWS